MLRVREIIRQAGLEYYTVGGGSIDIGNLPTSTARDLEKYVKSRISLKKNQNQRKGIAKKPSYHGKNDLAPSSISQPRLSLTPTMSRDIKQPIGHLPVFADTAPSFAISTPAPIIRAMSDERSNSSSFYSGTIDLIQTPKKTNPYSINFPCLTS